MLWLMAENGIRITPVVRTQPNPPPKDGELLANEFAPRVHNSGHWSIDGARTSQFENHLRAICDLQLGDPENSSFALMFNLLGEMPECFRKKLEGQVSIRDVHWHDYHKTPRAGRKIGHVTLTSENETELKANAAQLAADLGVSAELNLETVVQAVTKEEI